MYSCHVENRTLQPNRSEERNVSLDIRIQLNKIYHFVQFPAGLLPSYLLLVYILVRRNKFLVSDQTTAVIC